MFGFTKVVRVGNPRRRNQVRFIDMSTRGVAVATVAVLTLFAGDRTATPMRANVIDGPYARLLAQSTDLGPARVDGVQLTASLRGRAEPLRLSSWARAHGLSVQWRDGDDWRWV